MAKHKKKISISNVAFKIFVIICILLLTYMTGYGKGQRDSYEKIHDDKTIQSMYEMKK